jgi:hypothetical protein
MRTKKMMTTEERAAQMAERNTAICSYYQQGHTLRDCASHFKLGRMRVLQIVQAAGIWRPYERGRRTKFLGVNVTEETKDALRRKADERGVSVSRFASDTLDEVVK